MHKPRCSPVYGLILEITQKEISRGNKIQMDSRKKATLKGIKKHMISRHEICTSTRIPIDNTHIKDRKHNPSFL